MCARAYARTRAFGQSWGHLGATLGSSCGHLGAILEPSSDLLEPSWVHLGASWGHLGAPWGHLGAILGPSCGHLGAIFGHLEASWTQDAVKSQKMYVTRAAKRDGKRGRTRTHWQMQGFLRFLKCTRVQVHRTYFDLDAPLHAHFPVFCCHVRVI